MSLWDIARNAVSKSNLSDEGRSSLSDRKHYFFMLSWICRKANTHVKYDPATGGHFLDIFLAGPGVRKCIMIIP